MNSRVVRNGTTATALVLLFCSLCAAQTYTIRLQRHPKKGDRYRISGSGFSSQKSVVSAEGKVVTDETEFSAEFGVDGTALELGPDGSLVKEALTINNCLVKRDGTSKQLFPKGALVVAAVEDGQKVFRVNGKPVDKEAEKVLDMMGLISSVSSSQVSGDDIFGTGEPKAVGDSWNINSAAAVKSLQEGKITASQQGTKGTVTIEKRLRVGTEECLLISSTLDVDLIAGQMAGLKIDSGGMHARFAGAYPLDISHPAVERSLEISMRMTAKAKPDPSGPEIQVDVKKEVKVTAHYSTL